MVGAPSRVSMFSRKRGRSPEKPVNAAAAGAGRNKYKRLKEVKETSCFICYEEQGPLISCSKGDCSKVYHYKCVGRSEDVEDKAYKCRWVCGWHHCTYCQKTACYMCYTCIFSVCKGCKMKSKFVCKRENKGFCRTCEMTIMRIELQDLADDRKLGVNCDDKSSLERLFKFKSYWLSLKKRLSLTDDEIFGARNHRLRSDIFMSNKVPADEPHEESCDDAFRQDMKSGCCRDTPSVDKVQNGTKSTPEKVSAVVKIADKVQDGFDGASEELLEGVHDKKFAQMNSEVCLGAPPNSHKEYKGAELGKQEISPLNEYAAIDLHNISMIYLHRSSFENLIDDVKFDEKVVGSFVKIRILHSDRRQDMYRLVRVVGTCKANQQYKLGSKKTDINLEVLNLGSKEVIPIISVSNHDVTEDECNRLRNSIRCGLLSSLKVEEVLQKAKTLCGERIIDLLEREKIQLSHLRDRASEAGCRKKLYVKKLELLDMPEELERRLNEVPEVHTDPLMDPNYESTDEEETIRTKKDVVRPVQEAATFLTGTNGSLKSYATWEHSNNISNQGLGNERGGTVLQTKSIEDRTNANLRELGLQSAANKVLHPTSDDILRRNRGLCSSSCSIECSTEKVWLYEDPSGKTQGPFSLSSMRKWNNDKHFPPNLRIWRKSQKKAEAILLTDALSGNYHNHLLSSGGVHQSLEVSATKYCHAGGSNFKSPDSLWSKTKQYGGNLGDVNDGFGDRKSQFGSPQDDASHRPATYHGAMNLCGTQSYQVEEHPNTIAQVSLSTDSGRGYAPEYSSWDRQCQNKASTSKGWDNGADKNSRGSGDQKELPERDKNSETKWATPQDQDRERGPGKCDSCKKPSRSQTNNREYDGWQHAGSRTNSHRGCEMMPSASSIPDNVTWEAEKRNMAAEQSCSSRGNETSASERRTNLIKDEGFGGKGNNDWEKLTGRDRIRASDSQKWENWDSQRRNQTNSSGWPSWRHADSRKNAQQEKRIDSYHTVHTGWEAAPSETNVHSCGWEIPDKSVVAEKNWNSRVINTNEISAKERPTNVGKDDSWGVHVGKDKNVSKILTHRERSSADKWECWDKPSQSQMKSNGWDSWQHADTRANAPENLMEKDHNAYNGWEKTTSNNKFHHGSDREIADKKGAVEQRWNSRVNNNETSASKDDSWGVHVGKEKNVSKIFTQRERSSADKWECWDKPSQSQMNSNGWDSWQHADRKTKAPEKLMEKDHNSYTGWETTADKKGAAEQSWSSRGKFVEISGSERPKDVSQGGSWVAHTEKDTNSGWNKASQEKSSKNSVCNEVGQQDVGGSDPWDAAVKSALSKEICSREATGWGTSGSKNVNWNYNSPTTQTKQKGQWSQYRNSDYECEDKGRRDHRSPAYTMEPERSGRRGRRDHRSPGYKMEPERSGRRQFSRW